MLQINNINCINIIILLLRINRWVINFSFTFQNNGFAIIVSQIWYASKYILYITMTHKNIDKYMTHRRSVILTLRYKFSLRRTGTMCHPSENIHKKPTDKLSARRPRLRASWWEEMSGRRNVNTGSDGEAALQEAVTSSDRFLRNSFPASSLPRNALIWDRSSRWIVDNSHLCRAASIDRGSPDVALRIYSIPLRTQRRLKHERKRNEGWWWRTFACKHSGCRRRSLSARQALIATDMDAKRQHRAEREIVDAIRYCVWNSFAFN